MQEKLIVLLLAVIGLSPFSFSQSEITNPNLSLEIDELSRMSHEYQSKLKKLVSRSGENTQEVINNKSDLTSIIHNNYNKAKKILNDNGFPTISKVGEVSSHNFVSMIMDFEQVPNFQMKVLRLMETAMEKDDVLKADFAELTDVVRINSGYSQLYGTQSYPNPNGSSEKILYKIEKPNELNDRRKTLGLASIEIPTKSSRKENNNTYTKQRDKPVRY